MELDPKQYELLKADLRAEILKEITGQDLRVSQDATKPLMQVWNAYKRPLYKKFGTVTYHQVWECVRKLATFRAGHRYVRDLLPSEEEEAAEFVESILTQMGVEPEDKNLDKIA